ncbi:hypothetical protein KIN20_024780 [Parelaphostrongylus tenuis]|uniref:Uncharacterized protein n=1 Tax=Parelaphostrongylus tenuis TaxID=148309 RepID=A0AAD5MU10_PARTN|nr:hypothetical protein KIN20_024780 [Parelaphostrongylus tenuis]
MEEFLQVDFERADSFKFRKGGIFRNVNIFERMVYNVPCIIIAMAGNKHVRKCIGIAHSVLTMGLLVTRTINIVAFTWRTIFDIGK